MPRLLKQLSDDPDLVAKYCEAFLREAELKTVGTSIFSFSWWNIGSDP